MKKRFTPSSKKSVLAAEDPKWEEYYKKVAKNVEIDLEGLVKDITWGMDDEKAQVTVTFLNDTQHTFEFEIWRFSGSMFYISSDVTIIVNEILRYMKQEGLVEPDEIDAWEEVATKQVQDFDGFWTDYTLYYNEDEDRFVCIFGDKDLYNPTNTDPDFECEEKWEAFEWFEDYDTGEVDGEDDILESIDLPKLFEDIHDRDEYNWNLHGTNYEPFYEELKVYMNPGETWDDTDKDGWPSSTNVSPKELFSRMPKDKQLEFMNRFWISKDQDFDLEEEETIESSRDNYWTILVKTGWFDFLKEIENKTGMKIDSAFKRRRRGDNLIQLIDTDGSIYEAEITEYSNGDYELLEYNVRPM